MTTTWLSFSWYSRVLQPRDGRSKDALFPHHHPCPIHNHSPWHLIPPSWAYSHLCKAQSAARHTSSYNTAELYHFYQYWRHQEYLLMPWHAISLSGICPLFLSLSPSCTEMATAAADSTLLWHIKRYWSAQITYSAQMAIRCFCWVKFRKLNGSALKQQSGLLAYVIIPILFQKKVFFHFLIRDHTKCNMRFPNFW